MTSLPPAIDTGTLSILLLVFAAISGAGYTLRVLRRRERVAERRRAADLTDSLRDFLARQIPAARLASDAAAAEAGAFWTAIESLTSRGDGWLALSRALADCPHFEIERRALRDDSPWRRELAARRLGLLFAPGSRRALRAALRAGPELVTLAAASSLARYRDHDALRWLLAHPESFAHRPHRARVGLLRAFGRGALPAIADALERGTGDAALDRAILEVLGLGAYREARHSIERWLREGDVEQRVAAARALGRMEADDCASSLACALRDEAWPVRAQAAWALGRTRTGIALLALPARLTDPAWWVRRHAAYALRDLGPEGIGELRRIAHGSPDPYARDMAREALESVSAAA
ncbi:MAG TPA: HEAT repeat domain-containing protein [Terriglobales bacterium]|nr:HEAT repeat domain-containing protein [Terriglobales bacterium]